MTTATQTTDLGNNESATTGVLPQTDGTFLAMTFTRSRTFRTERGALAWLKKI